MRYLLNLLFLLCLGVTAIAQGPLITEIGYDNNYDQDDPFGIDSIEYVEIYLPDPQPTDPASFQIITYDELDPNNPIPTGQATVAFVRELEDTLRTWKTPNGKYYVIEFVDSTFFGYPTGGMRDGEDGVALVEIGSPNVVHQFWRYETCENFVAIDGPAAGATSNPITTDFSRTCGSAGVSLVQMNSALSTNMSIQQNGFGDWSLDFNTSRELPLENSQNVPVELMNFEVKVEQKNAVISWSTAQEFNNSHFDLLYSTDGRDFIKIQSIEGQGIYAGTTHYETIEYDLSRGMHYFRLKQVDFDGKFTLYDIRVAEINIDKELYIYPSLVEYDLNVKNADEGTEYHIVNSQGVLMTSGKLTGNKIPVSYLPSGTYFIRIHGAVKNFFKQ